MAIVGRGFKKVHEEQERVKKARENAGKELWRIFFGKNDGDIPVRFLTDSPVCFYEHTIYDGKTVQNHTCTDEDCPYCEAGDKSRFMGAFLVVDRRTYTYKDKNGAEAQGKDQVKLLVRGQQDLATLDSINDRHGLLGKDFIVYKTGTGTSTRWNFDRGETAPWSESEIQDLLPEHLRGRDFYEILEEQIIGDFGEEEEAVEELEDEVTAGVVGVGPKKKISLKRK